MKKKRTLRKQSQNSKNIKEKQIFETAERKVVNSGNENKKYQKMTEKRVKIKTLRMKKMMKQKARMKKNYNEE